MARLWHGILGDPPGNCPADGSRLDTLDRMERPTRHPTRSQTSSLLWHGTYATYSAIVTNRVLNDDALCAVPVDRLTVAMVGEWWERTITLWPDTAPRNRSAYQKLRAAIALAVEYGHIDHNVVNLRAARRQVKPKAKELPDTADMLSILNTVPHRFRLFHHEPKTQAGYRTVPVLSEFVHVVREHVDTYKPGAGCYATTRPQVGL